LGWVYYGLIGDGLRITENGQKVFKKLAYEVIAEREENIKDINQKMN